jgi:hypothetical protein
MLTPYPEGKVLISKPGLDRPRRQTLSRRQALELAGGLTALTFWQRKASGLSASGTSSTVSRLSGLPIATQHARQFSSTPRRMCGGVRAASARRASGGSIFSNRSRASVVGHPVPIADMGRVMFLEDVFLGSETDIAFLNSCGRCWAAFLRGCARHWPSSWPTSPDNHQFGRRCARCRNAARVFGSRSTS